jgi:3-hydroxyisobutyrate dehydrogenase
MAANLAKAGIPLVVHDAAPMAMAALAKHAGVRLASSPGAVASEVGVLFTALPNDAIVREVYLGQGGIASAGHAGLVTCDCSTVSAEATMEIQAALARRNVTHMDTPMLGSQPQAVSGEIFFIVGGDRSKVDVIQPYLDVMGRLSMYVGGPGTGNRVKLMHNGLVAVNAVAVAEALAVAATSGVDPYVFYEVVKNGGGMAYSTYFDRRVKRMLDGDFSPTFTAELMRKDAILALSQARALGVPMPILDEAKRTYDEAVDSGWAKEDFSAVTHVVEKRIGRPVSPNRVAGR